MKTKLVVLTLSWAAVTWAAAADSKVEPAVNRSALDLQRESLDRQRDSLRAQLGPKFDVAHLDFELIPPVIPLAESGCPALDQEELESLIATAAKRQSLSPQLLRAVMRQESGFKPCAVSVKGAQGLMQLMPATAARLHVADPFDPEQNVQAGAAFLKQLVRKYNGDLRLALVAYNAGASRADQLDPAEYPAETQGYLANIFAELDSADGY